MKTQYGISKGQRISELKGRTIEMNQSEEATYWMTPTRQHSKKGKTMKRLKRSVIVRIKGQSRVGK